MNKTILLVEDECDLAATCQRLLNRHGWSVAIAGSVGEAMIALARIPRPVLAIVDRQLPDGDGVDVLRKALAEGTPVIMVTGFGSAAARRIALDEGATAFLAKPFSTQDLLQLVRSIVGDGPGPATGPAIPPPAPDSTAPRPHC
jgi:DNA-binding response OmpR family regulator